MDLGVALFVMENVAWASQVDLSRKESNGLDLEDLGDAVCVTEKQPQGSRPSMIGSVKEIPSPGCPYARQAVSDNEVRMSLRADGVTEVNG